MPKKTTTKKAVTKKPATKKAATKKPAAKKTVKKKNEEKPKSNIRTRYAPSPTGFLHIGGARTALFSYLYAKHFNGSFIVRIEDTDISRNIADGEKSQLDNLAWLGIEADESPRVKAPEGEDYGPYRQSKKLNRYDALIEELIESGNAYKAYDSVEELTKQREEQEKNGITSFRYDPKWLKIDAKEKKQREEDKKFAIRLKLKPDTTYKWNDIVRGEIEVNTTDIGDFVIKKQDGYPTYNFAVVVDDYDMKISHVLRGEEHITNTPKQLAIYDAFDWKTPEFGHLTIITNDEGKKLSKRDSSVKQFIEDYKVDGYPAHAIFNFLTLLGWSHPEAHEMMTKQEIIESFTPERFSKSPSKFDISKMNWFAREYMKLRPTKVLKLLMEFENRDDEWIDLFIETYKQSASNLQDLKNSLIIYDNKTVKPIEKDIVVKEFFEQIKKVEFTPDGIQEAINKTKTITKKNGKDLFLPIRKATTYQDHGPELAKAIYLVGEDLVIQRLSHEN